MVSDTSHGRPSAPTPRTTGFSWKTRIAMLMACCSWT